jgi:hypothetical protein
MVLQKNYAKSFNSIASYNYSVGIPNDLKLNNVP